MNATKIQDLNVEFMLMKKPASIRLTFRIIYVLNLLYIKWLRNAPSIHFFLE